MIATRSPVARLGIQMASPLAIITGIYLLFAGHNQPGGGFAAGLVFGAVVSLRSVTGLQRPTGSMPLLVFGMVSICVIAVAPLVGGNALLDQQIVSADLPLIGKAKTGTALIFDIGVTAIVVGLIVAVLDGLGAAALAGDEPRRPTTEERS
ncbi:MAG: MnhB domain-containing protein [Actinomycetota bacterium]